MGVSNECNLSIVEALVFLLMFKTMHLIEELSNVYCLFHMIDDYISQKVSRVLDIAVIIIIIIISYY